MGGGDLLGGPIMGAHPMNLFSKCGRQIDNYCCYFFDLIGCIIGVEKSTQKGATNLTRESLRRLKEI